MIALKAIKYLIYDYCLETLFNKLSKNLKIPSYTGRKISIDDIREGTYLSKIILNVPGWELIVFRECRITKVWKICLDSDEWDGEYQIDFECNYMNGKETFGSKDSMSDPLSGTRFQSWNSTSSDDMLIFLQ